jgi:hypothetical protein
MARPFPDHERHALLSAWCDGSISDTQLERLDELLRTDPEFRDFYLEYMDQHALLAADVLPIEGPLLTEQLLRSVGCGPVSGGWAAAAEPGDAARSGPPVRPGRAPRSWRWWAAAAAAVLLLGLGLRFWPAGRREALVVTAPPSGAPPGLARPAGFAVVVQLAQVEWEPGDGRKPSEGDILSAGRLALRSGRLTLALLSGVTLTVEGPADLELLAIDRVHCRRGKLRTRVPAGAEGFVVSTPGSAVVDLGTEFALNVARDGKARMMVFEGEAEAAVLNASGSPLRSQQVEELHAIEIDPRVGQIEAAAARAEDFITAPALAVPPLALDPSYRDAVLEAGPWGYWRFETIGGGATGGEVAGCPPLRATGPVRLAVAGAGNRCVEFGPDETEQYLEMDGFWRPTVAPGYAVELWFLTGRIGHSALASLIEPGPPRDDYKHLFLIELTSSDRQSLYPPGSVRFLHRWPPGDSGGDNLFSSRYYVPNRWHHLVAQRNGGRMELYMDGAPTEPVSPRSDFATEACRLLLGRLKPVPRPEGRIHSRPFVGRIDELALYNRPLSPEEVRHHFELGARGGGVSRR